MATIVPRKNDKGEIIGWQAKIRRRGFPVQSRTFESYKAAEDWGKVIEAEMIRGVHVDRSKAERTTFGQVIEGYIEHVAPTHKGAGSNDSCARKRPYAHTLSPTSGHGTLKISCAAAWRKSCLAR